MPFKCCGLFAGLVGIIQAVIWIGLSVAFIVIYCSLDLNIPPDTGKNVNWVLFHSIYLQRGSHEAFIIYVIMIIYLVLSAFWFIFSLNLLLKIARHRKCRHISICTSMSFFFWSIITLLICLLDIVACIIIIHGLFGRFSPMTVMVPGYTTVGDKVLGPEVVFPLSTQPDYATAEGKISDEPLLNETLTTEPTNTTTTSNTTDSTISTTDATDSTTTTTSTTTATTTEELHNLPSQDNSKPSRRRDLDDKSLDDQESLRYIINKLLRIPHSIIKKQPGEYLELGHTRRISDYSNVNVLQMTESPVLLEIKDLDAASLPIKHAEDITEEERKLISKLFLSFPKKTTTNILKISTRNINFSNKNSNVKENEILKRERRRLRSREGAMNQPDLNEGGKHIRRPNKIINLPNLYVVSSPVKQFTKEEEEKITTKLCLFFPMNMTNREGEMDQTYEREHLIAQNARKNDILKFRSRERAMHRTEFNERGNNVFNIKKKRNFWAIRRNIHAVSIPVKQDAQEEERRITTKLFLSFLGRKTTERTLMNSLGNNNYLNMSSNVKDNDILTKRRRTRRDRQMNQTDLNENENLIRNNFSNMNSYVKENDILKRERRQVKEKPMNETINEKGKNRRRSKKMRNALARRRNLRDADILKSRGLPSMFQYPYVGFPDENDRPELSKYPWPLRVAQNPEVAQPIRTVEPREVTVEKNEEFIVAGTMFLLFSRCIVFWIMNLICAIFTMLTFCALTRRKVECSYKETEDDIITRNQGSQYSKEIPPPVCVPVCVLPEPECQDDNCSCHMRYEPEKTRYEPDKSRYEPEEEEEPYRVSRYKQRPVATCNIS